MSLCKCNSYNGNFGINVIYSNLRLNLFKYDVKSVNQSVISVASKIPLKTRLRICIDKTSHQHRPDEYIGFTPSCPTPFCNKIAPAIVREQLNFHVWPSTEITVPSSIRAKVINNNLNKTNKHVHHLNTVS